MLTKFKTDVIYKFLVIYFDIFSVIEFILKLNKTTKTNIRLILKNIK